MRFHIFISLINVVTCARILVFTYIPSVSHQNVFRSVWKHLSLKGHEVVAIATDPIRDPTLTNLTEIDVSVGYEIFKKFDYSHLTKSNIGLFSLVEKFHDSFIHALELEINTEEFQDLLQKPSDYFDLIIVESALPAAFGIQNKFKAPMLAMSSLENLMNLHSLFGNPVHPIVYPELFSDLPNVLSHWTIWEKIESLYILIGVWMIHKCNIYPISDKEARKYFGHDMPYIEDIMRNSSLMLINVSPVFSGRRPTAPNVVEYHNVHLEAINYSLFDLQKILDDAKEGAIYFSLGTNVRFDHVQGNIKQAILDALGELPYTVLCKWESEDFPGKPKNVILRKWFPQQAILAHPNVKVFVTQGGLQSSEEAIANAVPLVIIPFLGDQPMNAKILTKHGMAETISPKLLEKNILRDTILKVIGDEKYRSKAQELRSIFLDQPMSGIDKIIWWCEYVIRHKGAKHLRSPSADIPLYEYFMLDVFAVIFTALFVIYKIVSLAVRRLVGLIRGRKNKKQIKKKTN